MLVNTLAPPLPRTLPILSALALPLALAACGGDVGAAGGAAALDGPDVPIRPVLEKVYTVGALEGDSWETFGDLRGVEFDAEGRLHVLDADAGRIHVVGRDGTLVRSIGRKGSGPGEMQMPIGFTLLPGGRLAVFDLGARAFVLYGPDGAYLEGIAVDPDDGFPGRTLTATPDGAILSAGGIRIRMGPGGAALEEPPGRPIDRWTLGGDGGAAHDVAYRAWKPEPPEEADAASISREGGRVRITGARLRAFDAPLAVGVLSDGRFAVVDSVGYRVKLVRPDGRVASTLERPIPPRRVTDEVRERERERRRAELEQGGGSAGRMTVVGRTSGGSFNVGSDAIRRMQEDRIREMTFAEEIPVIVGLAVDRRNRIWVERAGSEVGAPGPIDVVTPEGRYLGTIPPDGLRLPDAFGPDGLVAYVERDALDVERVRVARITALGREGGADS